MLMPLKQFKENYENGQFAPSFLSSSLRKNGYYEILVERDDNSTEMHDWCVDKFGHDNFIPITTNIFFNNKENAVKTSFFFDDKENAMKFKLVWG